MNNYYEVDALNYSTLNVLAGNYPGQAFNDNVIFKESKAMDNGRLVDCLLTTPQEFSNEFVIADDINITDSIKNVIDKLVINGLGYNDEDICLTARACNFGASNWSDDTLLKRLKTDETLRYYNRKLIPANKIIISNDTYNQGKTVVEVLQTHEFSSWIFDHKFGAEVRYQTPLYWTENGVQCKALLDIIYIDHENNLIIPIDLKVKADSKYSFMRSFMQYRYYLQAAWYRRAIIKTLMTDELKNYSLQEFTFLVTSFEYPDPPILYRCPHDVIKFGNYGGVIDGVKHKGIVQLFDDYTWYKQTGSINYSRDLYESKGYVDIIL